MGFLKIILGTKMVLAILLLCVIAAGISSTQKSNIKLYTVEITFCDNRPHKTVTTEAIDISNNDISTMDVAVPCWRGYLNVCDLKVLKIEKIK